MRKILFTLALLLPGLLTAPPAQAHAGHHHLGESYWWADVTGVNFEIYRPPTQPSWVSGSGWQFAYSWVMFKSPKAESDGTASSVLQIGYITAPTWSHWKIYAYGWGCNNDRHCWRDAYAEVPTNPQGFLPMIVVNGAPGCMGAFANTTHVLTMCNMKGFHRLGNVEVMVEVHGTINGDPRPPRQEFRFGQVKDKYDRWRLWTKSDFGCTKHDNMPTMTGPHGADCYGFAAEPA